MRVGDWRRPTVFSVDRQGGVVQTAEGRSEVRPRAAEVAEWKDPASPHPGLGEQGQALKRRVIRG